MSAIQDLCDRWLTQSKLPDENDSCFGNAGIELVEVDEETWSRFEIPSGLDSNADELCNTLGALSCDEAGMALFSGATADDVAAFTRRGGEMHGIGAPLAGLSRAAVNSLSKVSFSSTHREELSLSP